VDILSGKLDTPLTDLIEAAPVLDAILELSKSKIYSHKPVIQVVAAGFQVLPGLLDTFLYALKEDQRESSWTILRLIPEEFKFSYQDDPYNAILSITTYIAGMTDTYAVDTYRNLRGIELPNY
jgi:dGTPase